MTIIATLPKSEQLVVERKIEESDIPGIVHELRQRDSSDAEA